MKARDAVIMTGILGFAEMSPTRYLSDGRLKPKDKATKQRRAKNKAAAKSRAKNRLCK